jgi:hypothetical protein
MKIKSVLSTIGLLILIWIVLFVGGEHGYTYYVEPAGADGKCRPGQTGPFSEPNESYPVYCKDPDRQCPVLWFPYVSQTPCPYEDILGGPWIPGTRPRDLRPGPDAK